MDYLQELERFYPRLEQEEKDKEVIQEYIRTFPDTILTRENEFAHMTSSSIIFNEEMNKVLMIFHNIYNSWSWTGGHADGDRDFLEIAVKEAKEETGIEKIWPLQKEMITLDILPVWGHVKNGKYVSTHQHLNYSYILMADEEAPLRIKADENSNVGWIGIDRLRAYVTEPDMIPVYEKIIRLAREKV